MTEFDHYSTFLARDHVLIGWLQKDIIRPLSNLFGETYHVFNIDPNKFVTLLPAELERLGVTRRTFKVNEMDEASAVRRTKYQQKLQAQRRGIL